MKKTAFLIVAALALLSLSPSAQAAPESTKKVQRQIVELCKDRQARIMLLHELTCTPERKSETVKKLQEDPELREVWDHNLDRS